MSRTEVERFARGLLVYAVATGELKVAGRANEYLMAGALRRIGKLANFGGGMGELSEDEGDIFRAGMLKQFVTLAGCVRNARDIARLRGHYRDDDFSGCKEGI